MRIPTNYRVEAKKGQRLSVEVEGMRLGRVLFDPYVSILDPNRFELPSIDRLHSHRLTAIASAIGLSLCVSQAEEKQSAQPNIVLIYGRRPRLR